MFSCVNLLVPPDDIQFLRTAHQIYRQHDKYTEAVSLAIRLGDHDLIKEDFEAAGHIDAYVFFIFIIIHDYKVLIDYFCFPKTFAKANRFSIGKATN